MILSEMLWFVCTLCEALFSNEINYIDHFGTNCTCLCVLLGGVKDLKFGGMTRDL